VKLTEIVIRVSVINEKSKVEKAETVKVVGGERLENKVAPEITPLVSKNCRPLGRAAGKMVKLISVREPL